MTTINNIFSRIVGLYFLRYVWQRKQAFLSYLGNYLLLTVCLDFNFELKFLFILTLGNKLILRCIKSAKFQYFLQKQQKVNDILATQQVWQHHKKVDGNLKTYKKIRRRKEANLNNQPYIPQSNLTPDRSLHCKISYQNLNHYQPLRQLCSGSNPEFLPRHGMIPDRNPVICTDAQCMQGAVSPRAN